MSGYLLCKCHPPPLIIPNPFLPPPNPHPCRPTALWAAGVEPYGPKVGKTQEDDHEEIKEQDIYGPMGAWANEMSIDDQEDSVEEHAKKHVLKEEPSLLRRHGSSRRPPPCLVSIVGRQQRAIIPPLSTVIVPAASPGLDASRATAVPSPEGRHVNFRSRRRVHHSTSLSCVKNRPYSTSGIKNYDCERRGCYFSRAQPAFVFNSVS